MFCVSVCIVLQCLQKKVIMGVVLKAPTILNILVFNQFNLEYCIFGVKLFRLQQASPEFPLRPPRDSHVFSMGISSVNP